MTPFFNDTRLSKHQFKILGIMTGFHAVSSQAVAKNNMNFAASKWIEFVPRIRQFLGLPNFLKFKNIHTFFSEKVWRSEVYEAKKMFEGVFLYQKNVDGLGWVGLGCCLFRGESTNNNLFDQMTQGKATPSQR